jgi:hypothetical protein
MRIIVTAVMLFTAHCAWAEAVKVTETIDTVFYVDPASIGSQDNFRRVAVIQDYAKQEPSGVRSRRVVYDIDCGGERLRSLSATEHSEPMAAGKPVHSWERESDWLYVAPRTGSNIPSRTTYRAIFRFVCSR